MSEAVKVLLVEDDPADVYLVREILSRTSLNCKLDIFSDGEEIIPHLSADAENRPDFMILDLNLPKKPGHQVLRDLRAHRLFKDIPVLVLTTSLATEDLKESYLAGANLFLTKPNRMIDLESTAESIDSFWMTARTSPHSVQFIRQRPTSDSMSIDEQ